MKVDSSKPGSRQTSSALQLPEFKGLSEAITEYREKGAQYLLSSFYRVEGMVQVVRVLAS
jgi:hypothetical protein